MYMEKDSFSSRENSLTLHGVSSHFLFNTLNSIVALCRINPTKAAELTVILGEYLDKSIFDKGELVPVSEELEHLKLFVKIQEVRFQKNLEFVYETEIEPGYYLIPPHVLQLICEWAIKTLVQGKLQINIKEYEEGLMVIYNLHGKTQGDNLKDNLQEQLEEYGSLNTQIQEKESSLEIVLTIPKQN